MSAIWDHELYQAHKAQVDYAWLLACEDDELQGRMQQYSQVRLALYACGIGNAKSDQPLDLEYSTTGAAARTGKWALIHAGLMYRDDGERQLITPAGTEYLQQLREHFA